MVNSRFFNLIFINNRCLSLTWFEIISRFVSCLLKYPIYVFLINFIVLSKPFSPGALSDLNEKFICIKINILLKLHVY